MSSSLPLLHQLSLPTPFPIGPINVYLAEGDVLTLIDCGPKDDAARAALEAGLAAHGCRLEDLRRLILTHHHVDHVGLAAEIVARSGAEVLTHPYNLPWLEDYTGQRERSAPFYRRVWEQGGVPQHVVERMRHAGEGVARYLEPLRGAPGQPARAGRTIDEGDGLAFAGREWRVYHTPGHAGGLVCLWEPESRRLISNDHLLRDISSNPVMEPPPLGGSAGPRPKRLVEYIREMQRMAALDPAVALTGHGPAIDDVPGLVRRRVAFHHRRARKIRDVLDAGGLTLWEITQPVFPKLTRGMDYFLALSEVQGHLDLLAEWGEVEAVVQGDVVRWRGAEFPSPERKGSHSRTLPL